MYDKNTQLGLALQILNHTFTTYYFERKYKSYLTIHKRNLSFVNYNEFGL